MGKKSANKKRKALRASVAAPVVAPIPAPAPKRAGMRVSHEATAMSRLRRAPINPFVVAKPPPGVVPATAKLAMDDAFSGQMSWAGEQSGGGLYSEGLSFLGFPYLAELAQRPEYRQISETFARHMTRNWITIKSKSGRDDSGKLAQLTDAMIRFGLQGTFRKLAEQDGLFGRAHLYVDLGTTDDRPELMTPIGDGWNSASQGKVTKGSIKAFRTVEAVWCYPSRYNTTDPLSPDWYNPGAWYVMGKEIHSSRFLRFVGREVPDLLKSAYSFGGLSLSQMCKKDIDFWLRDQRSVSDLINSFSVFVLSTDVTASLAASGDDMYRRAEIFNNLRDNSGLMLVDKESEGFENVSANLGTLDALRAQSQETVSAVSGIPNVERLGIQPAGLNASSEGEMETFEGRVHAAQTHLFGAHLHSVLGFLQLHEFGEVDPDIFFEFNPLWTLDEKEIREKELAEAQTDQILVDTGIVDVLEVRRTMAGDPDSRYAGIDVDDVPVPKPSELDDAPPEPKKAPEDDGEVKA